jgi:transposase
VGFEAGPLSPWLFVELKRAGLPVVCIEARHAKAMMAAMRRNKNDRNHAWSLVHLIRSGWFKAAHVKSSRGRSSERITREFFVNKLRDHENEIRCLLRPFGLKIGRVSARDFELRVRELAAGAPRIEQCMEALLSGRREMQRQLANLHRDLLRLTANDEVCRRFMTIPGVGPVTALAFKTTIDDPARFRRSSDVGAHLGLTPRQHQSGETDLRGRISRSGDAFTRSALFTAAHVMLTRSRQWTSIQAWGVRIAKRSSLKKAKIAVARKLAVVMHRMWRDDAPFRWGAAG